MSILAGGFRRAGAWFRWAWNPAPAQMITDHQFVPLDWDPGCGHLDHPQANRCCQARRYHTTTPPDDGGSQ